LLAFAEGRKLNCGDAGNIDLVLKKSADGGKTWGPLQVVWDDGSNTCGNPAPVLDSKSGHVVLLSTWNLGEDHEPQIIDKKSKDTRRIFVLRSEDDGMNWSKPQEITKDVKLPEWTWYATGPCNGIQIRAGKYKNRLVIPSDHIEAGTKKYYSHVIYSDDGGLNWKLGGTTPTDQVNECTVAELPGGKLLLNMRNYNGIRIRQTATSIDGGNTWSALQGDSMLIEPVCQASMIWSVAKGRKPVLAFSNPASARSRTAMTVKLSYDEGKSWTKKLLLHAGPAAYSNLVTLPNGNLACLYESGVKGAYENIVFKEMHWDEFSPLSPLESDPDFVLARHNAGLSAAGFSRSVKYVQAWDKQADPVSGLIPRNIRESKDFWNAWDAAADNYPYMVLVSSMLMPDYFKGRATQMLKAESALTSRIGRLPDSYSFSKKSFLNEKIDTGQIIFGTAEYMKDGLIPLTEWKVRGVHNCVQPRSMLLKGLLEVCFDVFYVFDAYTHANLVG
jgi:sialidase-1